MAAHPHPSSGLPSMSAAFVNPATGSGSLIPTDNLRIETLNRSGNERKPFCGQRRWGCNSA